MDATPLTLGQEFSGYAAQLAHALGAHRGVAAACARAGVGRHRGGHRAQHASGIRRASRRRHRRVHGHAVRLRAQQVRGARGQRRAGAPAWRAARARRRADEDRERRALARERAAVRSGRDHHSRERAGQLDHAGQGQSDAVRSADDDRGAGDGQRRRRRHRRGVRQLRVERLQAAHHPQRAAERAPADRRHEQLRRALRARDRARPRAHRGARGRAR